MNAAHFKPDAPLTLDVDGVPATFATAGERPWKEAVRLAVQGANLGEPPVARWGVRIEFRTRHVLSANDAWDIDNLIKPTLDALEGVFGLRQWRGMPQAQDDRVDYIEALKRAPREGEKPGARIELWILDKSHQSLVVDG